MNTEPKIINCTPHIITQYRTEDIDFSDLRHLHLFDEEHAIPKRQWKESGIVASATKVETGGDLSFKFRQALYFSGNIYLSRCFWLLGWRSARG